MQFFEREHPLKFKPQGYWLLPTEGQPSKPHNIPRNE